MDYNFFLTIPSPWVAEILADTGYDSLTLDMQHGLISYDSALPMMQVIQARQIPVYIRLRWNEPSHIMQMLDAGADGLICPMIRSAEDVRKLLNACQYPPLGDRSYGPIRASLNFRGNYFKESGSRLKVYPMIETQDALNDAEEIAKVTGISGLYVGPYDLSVSLGLKNPGDVNDPILFKALEKIINICKDHGLESGIFTSSLEHVPILKQLGFSMISYGTDTRVLSRAVMKDLDQLKSS